MWQVLYLIFIGPCVNALMNNNVDSFTNVITTHGRVRGLVDDGILQFFDIPYGKLSQDNLFQEPGQPNLWKNTLENQKHESRCPQIIEGSVVGDLNCLTLSVFKKHTTTVDATKADVLFHIHDSFFSNGSGDPLVYGPKYLVQENIILVLPNYRLGALGFLCLQNETAPGNAALKDLTLALKWTVENIDNFGGNASNIVISGAGAGGALVEYLLISNESRTYISRAITESGFSLSHWAIDRNPIATASPLARLIQSEMDLEKLVRDSIIINFRPCIEKEGGFISESPWKLLGKHRTHMIAYMTGSANHAAWGKAVNYNLTQLNGDLSLLLPSDLVFRNDVEKLRIAREVKAFYFGERDVITRTDVNQLSQLFTDSEYLNPGLRGARVLAKGGANVYFYEYSFNNPDLQQAFNASTRGDSLAYVFSRSDQAQENAEQAAMRKVMMNLWVNFIKSGTPSSEDLVTWNNLRDVVPADEEWLSIGAEVQIQRGIHHSRLRLWNDIYDNYFVDNSGFVHKPMFQIYLLVSGPIIFVRNAVFKA